MKGVVCCTAQLLKPWLKRTYNVRHASSSSSKSPLLTLSRSTVITTAVFLGGAVGYRQYWKVRERESIKLGRPLFWPRWRQRLYYSMPYRLTSRLFGCAAEVPLPAFLRRPIIGSYAWWFECALDEAVVPQTRAYRSLADFFSRPLLSEARPISDTHLVSPADGRVLVCGEVRGGLIEQVKGISYTMDDFFGGDVSPKIEAAKANNTKLLYCVVYLAPGDYHGFHSPANWSISARRHFSGLMLSVRQRILTKVPRVFCLNERVLLCGDWDHGFFSMTAVGATNVGNIKIADDELSTNRRAYQLGTTQDRQFSSLQRTKGEKMGEFRLGSSVVLVFEAPVDRFYFTVQPGDAVKYGQSVGFIRSSDSDDTTKSSSSSSSTN